MVYYTILLSVGTIKDYMLDLTVTCALNFRLVSVCMHACIRIVLLDEPSISTCSIIGGCYIISY